MGRAAACWRRVHQLFISHSVGISVSRACEHQDIHNNGLELDEMKNRVTRTSKIEQEQSRRTEL
jgi:hypothetical protein